MNDNVKWIRIKVGMFDGHSFKRVKKAKIDGVVDFRDKLTAVWFELLDLGGKVNNSGFLINDEIAFRNYEDIAIALDRTEKEITMCIEWYIENNMMEIVDNILLISNWSKYQNEDGLEKLRLQNAERQRKFRENQKQKLLELQQEENSNVTVTLPVTQRNANPLILNSISNSNSNISNIEKKIKKKKEYDSIDIQINNYTLDVELKEVLMQFVDMRKKLKKPLTDYAFKLILKKLTELSKDVKTQKEIINQSVMNSWQDVYPLKQNYVSKFEKKEKPKPDWYDNYEKQLKGEVVETEEIAQEKLEEMKRLVKDIYG